MKVIYSFVLLLATVTVITSADRISYDTSRYTLEFELYPYDKMLAFEFHISNLLQAKQQVCSVANHQYNCCINVTADDGLVKRAGCISFGFSPKDRGATLKMNLKNGTTDANGLEPKKSLEFVMNPFGYLVIFNFQVSKLLPNETPQICEENGQFYNCCFSLTFPAFGLLRKMGCLSFEFPPRDGAISLVMTWEGGVINQHYFPAGIEKELKGDKEHNARKMKFHKEVKDMRKAWTDIKPCSCAHYVCECCIGSKQQQPLFLGEKYCIKFKPSRSSNDLNVEIAAGDDTVHNSVAPVNAFPEHVCVAPSKTSMTNLCFRLKDFNQVGKFYHVCPIFQAFYEKFHAFDEHLGCFTGVNNQIATNAKNS